MSEEKQNGKTGQRTAKKPGGFWHWIRVAVMFVSGGFIFPHAMTEDDEAALKDSTDKATKVKTE